MLQNIVQVLPLWNERKKSMILSPYVLLHNVVFSCVSSSQWWWRYTNTSTHIIHDKAQHYLERETSVNYYVAYIYTTAVKFIWIISTCVSVNKNFDLLYVKLIVIVRLFNAKGFPSVYECVKLNNERSICCYLKKSLDFYFRTC
jgi:hypothetical protein